MSVLASSGGGGALQFFVIPLITVTLLGFSAAIASYPLWKDRARKAQERHDREMKIDRAMDHVLGCEADDKTGKPAVVGLVHTVPELARNVKEIRDTIGPVAPGQTVMGSLNDCSQKIANVGLGQATLSETVDAHMLLDDNRFRDINRELGAKGHEIVVLRRDTDKAIKGIRDTVTEMTEHR